MASKKAIHDELQRGRYAITIHRLPRSPLARAGIELSWMAVYTAIHKKDLRA